MHGKRTIATGDPGGVLLHPGFTLSHFGPRWGVQRIKSAESAFAAILVDGSVVTWGHPLLGGDSDEMSGWAVGGRGGWVGAWGRVVWWVGVAFGGWGGGGVGLGLVGVVFGRVGGLGGGSFGFGASLRANFSGRSIELVVFRTFIG